MTQAIIQTFLNHFSPLTLKIMQHLKNILLIICLLYTGCASTNGIYEQTQSALSNTIDEMYQAAVEHNTSRLYSYLSHATREQYTESEFKEYFDQNDQYIIDYLGKLRDETQIQPYSVRAIQTGDPCGSLSLTLNTDDQWILDQIPERNAIDNTESRKLRLLNALRTKQFVRMINSYSQNHPEIAPENIREILRLLDRMDENHISFSGQTAILSMDESHEISMICTKEGWILHRIY